MGLSFVPDNLQVHFFFGPAGTAQPSMPSNTSPVTRPRPSSQTYAVSSPSRPATSVSPNINQLTPSITVSRVNNMPITPYATTDVINVTRETPMSLPPNTMRRMSDPAPYSPSMIAPPNVNNQVVSTTTSCCNTHSDTCHEQIPTANQFPTAFTMNQPNTMPFNPSMNPVTPSFPNTMNYNTPNLNNINNITNSMGNMNLNPMSVPNMNFNNPVNTPNMPYNPDPSGYNSFNPIMGPSVTYNTNPAMLPIYTPPNITGPAFPSNPSYPMPTGGSVLPQPSYPSGYPNNPYPY